MGVAQFFRRSFLITAAALLSLPLAVVAQSATKPYRIGFLSFHSLPNAQYEGFRQGLRDLNYLEGRDVVIVTRTADQVRDRLPQLASELVAEKPHVIVTNTGTATLAIKRVTSSVPVIMLASSDAVRMGIVSALARPGGNVTGFTIISPDLAPKRLELLTALPGVQRIAALWCPEGDAINHEELRQARAAAARLGVELVPVEYRQRSMNWESLAAALRDARPQGLFHVDCTTLPLSKVFEYAIRQRLPMITPYLSLAESGVLLTYGANTRDMARRAATLLDKILKGAKPADLPVEQPTKFELVINLKTARAIGISIPQSVLVRADRIIE